MRLAPALLALALLLPLAVHAASPPVPLWPAGPGHDHSSPAQHAGLGFGLHELGYLNLGEPIGEVDLKRDFVSGKLYAAVALLNAGFALVDATDPANPVLIGKTRSLVAGYGADVKMADDGNTVYLAINSGSSLPPCLVGSSPVIPFVPAVPLVCGIQVYDTIVKSNPVFLGTLPSSTSGTHMMDYEQFNGLDIIAGTAQGSPQNVPLSIAGADKVPVTVGHIASPGLVHDVTLRADPLDGTKLFAWLANWNVGVRVVDVTLPAQPVELGRWVPPAGSGGQIHTVMPFTVGGKRLIAAEQETFYQNVVSTMWILDATDLGNIHPIGQWQNPDGKTSADGFTRWSTHNLDVLNGQLWMGHYHGGVVLLDVSTLAKASAPVLIGNFLPSHPAVGGAFSSDVPFTWDVEPQHDNSGVAWVTDINTGLYSVVVA